MRPWMPLALVLALGLAGCGDDEAEQPPTQGETVQADQPTETAEAEAAGDDEPPATPSEMQAAEAPTTADDADVPPSTSTSSAPASLPESEPSLGGTSDPDVDAILEETERRFEEASRRIDEQFEQAERERPEAARNVEGELQGSGETSDAAASEDAGMADQGAPLTGSSDPEVEAILEETERRFEEASRKLDEQFEQAERQVPEQAADTAASSDD